MVLIEKYKFTESDREELEELLDDITILKTEEIIDEIQSHNGYFDPVYTRYGNNYLDYEYQVIAGRLVYFVLLKHHDSVKTYLNNIKFRLIPEVYNHMENNIERLEPLVKKYEKLISKTYSYFGICSMINTYLARDKYEGNILETPVLLHLRCGFGIFQNDIEQAINYFEEACKFKFCMASPVLFNAGFKKANMASCFLLNAPDNLTGLVTTAGDAAIISKNKGGVGMDVSNIRHSEIGIDGMSKGVIPYLKIIDDFMNWIDQTGKRPGAATTSCQAHHIDIEDLIDCVKKTGDDNMRVKRLNVCIYFPNLFWKRWYNDEDWTLFCPAKVPGLNEAMGEEYDKLYEKYEADKTITHRKTIKARNLLQRIINVQRATGMPYMTHKDNVNYKCNQYNPKSDKHNEIIKGPNLCLEIFERSNSEETGVCNLGQLSLPYYVKRPYEKGLDIKEYINFEELSSTTRFMIRSLNRVIDHNYYPTEKGRTSNMRHRPVGLGVSGYSDMIARLNLRYEDEEVFYINKVVFACIYFNAVLESCLLAMKEGPYPYFKGSPLSEGKFQFDLWREETEIWKRTGYLNDRIRKEEDDEPIDPSVFMNTFPAIHDLKDNQYFVNSWDNLRNLVVEYGVRNSMLTALMPSASTSRILENAESIEPHQSNLYSRVFVKDTFVVTNKYAYYDLKNLNVWNAYTAQFISSNRGSLKNFDKFIEKFPEYYPNFDNNDFEELKLVISKYKTALEISQKAVFKQNSDRGRYICQSQSSNVFFNDPTTKQMEAFHYNTWASGLKTGMYYLRQLPLSAPEKLNVEVSISEFVASLEEGDLGVQTKRKSKYSQENFKCEGLNDEGICISCT